MNKIRIAIVGYGNLGKAAVEAVCSACDMELAGIVVRRALPERDQKLLNGLGINVVNNVNELGKVDVALLCVSSRSVPEVAKQYLSLGINTVDSYDMHSSIADLRTELDAAAKENGAVSILSAGWDPGSDSVVRALMEAIAPNGITYTNFGSGMSMGHTVAAKSIAGVKNALSVTIPLGTSIHRRMVYVELQDGADFKSVEKLVKEDAYFAHDETHVIQTDNVNALIDMGHAVEMTRKGVSGAAHNQQFTFKMSINNPALTTQVMTSCARASVKQKPGAYTMIEIPVIDMLFGDRDSLIRKLV